MEDAPQAVHLRVEALPDELPLPDGEGGIVAQGAADEVRQVLQGVQLGQLPQAAPVKGRQQLLYMGKPRHGVFQGYHVPAPGGAVYNAAHQPLHVADAGQGQGQLLPGHGVVADDAILQREDGGDVVGRAAHHCKGLVAGLKHAVLAGIHRHHAGLVEHDALPLLRDDDGRRTKIDTDVVLCHNRDISFLCCPFSISIAHLRARVIKTHYSITQVYPKRNPLKNT